MVEQRSKLPGVIVTPRIPEENKICRAPFPPFY